MAPKRGKSLIGAVLVIALTGLTVVGMSQTPASAAVTKQLVASCSSDNPAISAILGPSVGIPFSITYEGPTELQPDQDDVPVSFTWGLALPDELVTLANGQGVTSVQGTNIHADLAVSGPTDLTEVPGRPPDMTIVVAPGASTAFGPFGATITNIGSAGSVRFALKDIAFTINLSIAGASIVATMTCAPGATVISVPVKVPGAPDITQPISITGAPGQAVDVDVLGQYVKPGVDKSGQTKAVLPETLKIIDGPAAIQNGHVVVTNGASGTTTATFEVCAADIVASEGVSEVETLTLANPATFGAVKKSLGFTLNFDGQVTSPIWTHNSPFSVTRPTSLPADIEGSTGWQQHLGGSLLGYLAAGYADPDAATIQSALEALPNVGAGNIKVTQNGPQQYTIEFLGTLAKTDVPEIKVEKYFSLLPQEWLQNIIGAAQGLAPDPNAPPGPTADELRAQAQDAITLPDIDVGLYFQLRIRAALQDFLDNLDVNALIASLTGLFAMAPAPTTTTAGEDPNIVKACSQGVIEVSVLGASVTAPGGAPTGGSAPPGASLAFTG